LLSGFKSAMPPIRFAPFFVIEQRIHARAQPER